MSRLPLSDVLVVDLSRVLAGPLCTMVLGDFGADVIKVEHPERGDDTRDWGVPIAQGDTSYYYAFNRNKRSIALDLGTESGVADVRKLIAKADVVVENFKTGGMERFGLGYEALRALNPGLIYCSISGYGRLGQDAERPGYDLVIQGETGLMAINGEPGRPPLKFGVAAVDMYTGLSAAQAVLAALFDRGRTGTGRRIDLALYDCGVALSAYCGLEALLKGRDPPRVGNAHPSIVPYGVFEAQDGPVVIAVGNNRQFQLFCMAVIERPDLASNPRYQSNLLRSQNRGDLLPEIDAALLRLRRAPLLEKLTAAGIPCGEVLGLHEALTNPRTERADLVTQHAHPLAATAPTFNPPWRFDGERPAARRPPRLGEDEAAIRRLYLDP